MLSSTHKSASVHELLNEQEDVWFVEKGYKFSVVIEDEYGDVLDILDFKTEFAAHTYADAVNLTQRTYPYA